LGEYQVKSPAKRLAMKFFAVLLVVIAPVVGWSAYQQYREAKASVSWPSVQGVVNVSQVERQEPTRRVSYRAHVEYSYAVNDQQYTGRRLRLNDARSTQQSAAQAIVDRYRVGSPVTVFYDPTDPKSAALEVGVSARSYLYFAIALGLLVLAVVSWRGASARVTENEDAEAADVAASSTGSR